MKNKIVFLIAIMLAFVLSGCVLGNVKDKMVVKDILAEFQNEYQKIENIEIIKSDKKEKTENVYVSFELQNQVFEAKRYYQLTYDYYDRGGWMLNGVNPYQENRWEIYPIKGYEPSKDIIAEELFVAYNAWAGGSSNYRNRGFILSSKISNAFFKNWTLEADRKDKNPAEYITNIEYIDEHKNNLSYAVVTIETESYVLKITEKIKIMYEFSPTNEIWECTDMQSIEHKMENIKAIEGNYEDEFRIDKFLSDGYIMATYDGQSYKYRVDSVYMGGCGEISNSKKRIHFYEECFSFGPYFGTYEYEQRE